MSELRDCPFCGGEAWLYSDRTVHGECWHCACNDCEVVLDTHYETKADAIATWNRRPAPDVEKVARAIADVIAKRHGHAHTDWMNDERREEARAALRKATDEGMK